MDIYKRSHQPSSLAEETPPHRRQRHASPHTQKRVHSLFVRLIVQESGPAVLRDNLYKRRDYR